MSLYNTGPSGRGNGNDGEYTVVNNAQEAAELVLTMAEMANTDGTFGVGGAIIENRTGRVLVKMRNRVLQRLDAQIRGKPGETWTFDPTAHGERQLVQWYYENRHTENLPAPHELTIVTTLDPCAMCTGALLTAGFNAGIIAIDAWSGINHDGKFEFSGLPNHLRRLARKKFGYYAVDHMRGYIGGNSVAFRSSSISRATYHRCLSVFLSNMGKIQKNSQASGLEPAQLRDPARLPDNSAVKEAFRACFAPAFSHRLAYFRAPDRQIGEILSTLVHNTPYSQNAVALIDPFGNLIVAAADRFDLSPVATAFMNVVQTYSTMCFDLINTPAISTQARQNLTHPKYGTFVFLHAPSPHETAALMDLGAYGSTMEGALPQKTPGNFQYYYPPRKGTLEELTRLIMGLPPFYVQTVGISPEQVR